MLAIQIGHGLLGFLLLGQGLGDLLRRGIRNGGQVCLVRLALSLSRGLSPVHPPLQTPAIEDPAEASPHGKQHDNGAGD
ncbi:hypothetical protein BVL52_08880 [Pseudomonas oryzihabitans]|uniref:Secreted protein n=1 Tax=Pseudomonas oryzihabitans TaxID=47885 RepID=A0ABX3IV44_9PSED|nr:hypothetical protein BVL52_08880 [Pseudomonas psychrotolerans]